MFDLRDPETQFILDAVRQASLLTRQVRQAMGEMARKKADLSPVTVGDLSAQALASALLEEAFPGDALIAEEDAAFLRGPDGKETLKAVTAFVDTVIPGVTGERVCGWIDRGSSGYSKRFWTLDPVDGTKGYLRGGQYVTAMALVEDGQVVLGALGCPNLPPSGVPDFNGKGSLVVARRGDGAWAASMETPTDLLRWKVSNRSEPDRARLLISYENAHTNMELIDQLVRRFSLQDNLTRLDSQAKYAALASGKGEAIVRLLPSSQPARFEKIWDIAAGAIVVEEAGGRVTDVDGIPLDFCAGRTLANNRGILATNGVLHDLFQKALAAYLT